jgi:hypothetical protein
MHLQEKHGPKGKMELSYEHHESGYGHTDIYRTASLAASKSENESVTLRIESGQHEAIRPSIDKSVKRYSISARAIIEFIKANGKEC